MEYANLSAIELQREIEQAEALGIDGWTLLQALREIERLRIVCQDIIEIIGVEYAQFGNAEAALDKIDDIAHRYWISPVEQGLTKSPAGT